MEKVETCILALLLGALLVLASLNAEAQGKKDKTLDPDTCQEAGTCWIPAGGKPQPILKNVKKGTFKEGYETGKKFALPGTKKGDGVLLWMALIEEWYGPWILMNLGPMSYFAAVRRVKFESNGNPYAATESEIWIERALTSLGPEICEKYDFDPCGDAKIALWGMAMQNLERREKLATHDNWDFLDDWPRSEKELWMSFSGSVSSAPIRKMAKKAKVHKITPEQREAGVTPWKRLIGMMKKWDNTGALYVLKSGIAITNWRLGFRGGRCKNNHIVFPQICGDDCQDGMAWGSEEFYDPDDAPPMPKAKYKYPGAANFGKRCKAHQKEWRAIMGKVLSKTLRRGTPKFKKMQEAGFFPTDEEYAWFDENIGPWRISDSPVVKPLLEKLNEKNPPGY